MKDRLDRLRAVALQLQNLDAQKQVAIGQDNFDDAKRIKMQMEQLKYSTLMQASNGAQ